MDVDGTWWWLIDEEVFDEKSARQLTLLAGAVLDGRTDARLGSYNVEDGHVTIQLGASKILCRFMPDAASLSGNLFAGKGRNEMVMPVALYPLDWRPPSAEEVEQMLRNLYPDRVGNTGPLTNIRPAS